MSEHFGLPVSLDVAGKRCLILGGGPEATDKARRLLRAGAAVQVIAEEVEEAVADMAHAGELGWAARGWIPHDVKGAFLVYVTPDERERAQEAYDLALSHGAHICAIDEPAQCTFATPAVVEVGDLRLALSSGGRAPALLKRLREDLERALCTEQMRAFVEALGAMREQLPRGERGAQLKAAVAGFRVELQVEFPAWFHEHTSVDDDAPSTEREVDPGPRRH